MHQSVAEQAAPSRNEKPPAKNLNKTGRASVLSAITVCVTLLLLRSWFFLAWEESYFHSDQAVIGLMAKHLAEGRSFPLFFYGQEYMLGVESWWAAPFI